MRFVLNRSTSAPAFNSTLPPSRWRLVEHSCKDSRNPPFLTNICTVPAAQVWDAWHSLQEFTEELQQRHHSWRAAWGEHQDGVMSFYFGRAAWCFGKDQRAMHCHSSCSYYFSWFSPRRCPPSPPPPQSAQRLFARATLMCPSAPVSSSLTLYTGPTPELLVWIPLKEHYNMNEIYCTGTKCGWLPCPLIRKTMKTAWPWAPAALLCLARD